MNNSDLKSTSLYTNYWKKKILNRDKTILLENKLQHLPSFSIKANELHYFNKLTNRNKIAQYTVVTAIYTFLLNKLILDFDGYLIAG
ncbi:hypothetical protein EV144_1111, partial [Flavobacterium sp. 270]|uniref:hypothetical protein n=1 Tax=Flavobacterium sp. 270 TaxID=2512114 RepID=UPI0010D2A1C5